MSSLLLHANLSSLRDALTKEESLKNKLVLVQEYETTKIFLREKPSVDYVIRRQRYLEQLILYSTIAIGQGSALFHESSLIHLPSLIDILMPIEMFYKEIGGIVGYHVACMELLAKKTEKERKGKYHRPDAIEISKLTKEVRKAMISGIRNLDACAEIYPIGGAADRLCLKDEVTGEFQTAASLEFCGRTLLQRLIDDLQAREYLHFKLFNKHIEVPLVMMTSDAKKNDEAVKAMFKNNNWFGRKPENFFLFSQPLVPAMNRKGKWEMLGPYHPLLKPGGHGVIWKLASEMGALDWLEKKGVRKVLMRQINNMIAGVDHGIATFMGIGFDQDKTFGFAACPRAEGVSEGVNVVIENDQGYCLTNIEYCDFEHFEINETAPLLANTNLLFVDVNSIEKLIEKNPIPGMLVNLKKMKIPGGREEEVLRLESTMQNLADQLVENKLPLEKSFITSNARKKTISSIKREFAFGSALSQTPEQCFLDLHENGRELLDTYCGFKMPPLYDEKGFFEHGLSFIFLYHPSLGPFYEIIAQKLRKGRLAEGSELRLEIAELDVENLQLDGSLSISTEVPMGHLNEVGKITYSNNSGKCTLKNVVVKNLGIDRKGSQALWKDEIVHKEKCEIFIEEGGELLAEDVLIEGNRSLHVPSGVRVTLSMEEGKLSLLQEVIEKPTWFWSYSLTSSATIELKKREAKSLSFS